MKKNMTPIQLVEPILDGMTNEECESIAVAILAQLVAKQIYVHDNDNYLTDVMKKVVMATDEFRKENAFVLALAKILGNSKDD